MCASPFRNGSIDVGIVQTEIAEPSAISALQWTSKSISVPLGFLATPATSDRGHPTATVAIGMRSSMTNPCLASSARCHIMIEHEGAGQGARGQGAPRRLGFHHLCSRRRHCDATAATAARRARRPHVRASSTRRSTRPARSGRCGGATAAAAVRRLQRGAQQCCESDARSRRRRGRLAFIRWGRVRRRARRVCATGCGGGGAGGETSVATRRIPPARALRRSRPRQRACCSPCASIARARQQCTHARGSRTRGARALGEGVRRRPRRRRSRGG